MEYNCEFKSNKKDYDEIISLDETEIKEFILKHYKDNTTVEEISQYYSPNINTYTELIDQIIFPKLLEMGEYSLKNGSKFVLVCG